MHTDRGIVCTDIWSGGQSMRPDDQKTLTRQFVGTDDTPRDSWHGLVTWNPEFFFATSVSISKSTSTVPTSPLIPLSP